MEKYSKIYIDPFLGWDIPERISSAFISVWWICTLSFSICSYNVIWRQSHLVWALNPGHVDAIVPLCRSIVGTNGRATAEYLTILHSASPMENAHRSRLYILCGMARKMAWFAILRNSSIEMKYRGDKYPLITWNTCSWRVLAASDGGRIWYVWPVAAKHSPRMPACTFHHNRY